MKKQGRQLNILNSLFLKNSKEQKSSSREIPDSQIELKASKELGVAIRQKKVSNMVGRSNYSSELRTHKQLLEKYLQHSEKYFNDLAEYKKGYLVLNRSLEDLNQLSQKMTNKKEEYTSEMVKYEGIKQKYEQSLKEYQEITEEYENIIQDREVVQRKFEEHSIALKKINDEVQELFDKKSEKKRYFC